MELSLPFKPVSNRGLNDYGILKAWGEVEGGLNSLKFQRQQRGEGAGGRGLGVFHFLKARGGGKGVK